MVDIPTIEPFQFIRSTAFSERVQLANKLNEVIDAVNSIGDLPDLENQITEINSKISELEESIGNTDTSLAELENQLNSLISEVNTTINQAISALESDVEGIDARLTTAEDTISEHGTEIDGLLKEVIDGVEMLSNPHGTIQVQINHEDGSNDISAPIDLGLVEQGGIVLQSGTTDRSFKLIVNLTDGTSWQTNDFVIPEGGGTDVSVTNISIAQGTESNMIQVKIGLSDGSAISSNDWTVVTPSEFSALGTRVSTAEGNITKNTGDISDLETRVQAIEDSPGFTLQPATATRLGGVKIGSGITVQSDGTIAVDMKKINTAAVASTVMFTADASKVTLHADSIAGSEFTKDIPQASQGGAGTIDAAAYQKLQNVPAPDTIATNTDITNIQDQIAQMKLSKASPNQATLNGGSIQLVESVTLNIEGTTLKTNVNGIEGEVTIPGSELSFNGTHHTFSRCVNEIYDNYSYAERGLIIFSFIQPNYKVKFAASGFYNSSRRIVGYAVGTVNDEPINFIRVNKESESSYSMEFILYDENWSNPTTKLTLDQTHGSIECSFIQIAP